MVKISSLLQTPSVKILLFLLERGEVRYTDLTKLMTSRGTLSLNLKELSEEGLMQRRILTDGVCSNEDILTIQTLIFHELYSVDNTMTRTVE